MKVIKIMLVIALLFFASTAQAQLTDEEQACVNAGTCDISLPPATGQCEPTFIVGEIGDASFCATKVVKYDSEQMTDPPCIPFGASAAICDVVPYNCRIHVNLGSPSGGSGEKRMYYVNNAMMCDKIIEKLMESKPIEFKNVELATLYSVIGGPEGGGSYAYKIMTLDIQ